MGVLCLRANMKINLQNILIIAVVILATLQVQGLFRSSKPVQDRSGEIKALEKVIEAKESERDIYRAWKDETVALLQKRDSALKTEYKTTVVKYEKIPANIRNLSNEELRRAVESY